MVVIMRGWVLLCSAFILQGCLSDQDQVQDYFDSINSRPPSQLPSGLQSANPTTPQITTQPIETGVTDTTTTSTQVTTQPVSTGANTQTSQDRRVVNTGDNPPPEYVDSAVAAPSDGSSEPQRDIRVDTKPVELGKPTQSINLREYAASQRHLVGTRKYIRNPARYSDGGNCKNYTVPEVAQIAFLSEGGPRQDKLLLDRDGDGFACGWTPDMAR